MIVIASRPRFESNFIPLIAFLFRSITSHRCTKRRPCKDKGRVKSLSRVRLCDPLDHQVPPSMGFSRQEYWSGLPFPSPGDLPVQGLNPHLMSPELAGRFFTTSTIWRRRQWHPTPVLLPGKSHGRRSLVDCSPWVAKSRTRLSDFTFTFHFSSLEKEMATHSSVLAWRIPGTGESGGLPSLGSHRVGHD